MRAIICLTTGALLLGGCSGGAVGDLQRQVSMMSSAVEGSLWEFEGSFPFPPTTLLKGYELVLTDSSTLDLRHFRCSKRDDSAPNVALCDAGGDYKWEREVSSWPLRQIDAASIAVQTGNHAGETTHSLAFSCDFEADCEDNLRFNLISPMMVPCGSAASCNRIAEQLAEAVALARSDAVRLAAREHLEREESVADGKAARARLGEVNLLAFGTIDNGNAIGASGWLRLDDDLGLFLNYYRCDNSERDREAAAEACRTRQPYPNPLQTYFALPAPELARLTIEVPNDGHDQEVVLHCAAEPCFTMRVVHDARQEYRPGKPESLYVVGCATPEDCTAIAKGLRDVVTYVAGATNTASSRAPTSTDRNLDQASVEEQYAVSREPLEFDTDDWTLDDFFFYGPDPAALEPLVRAINEDIRSGVADDGDEIFAIGATLSDDHWANLALTLCAGEGESAIARCRAGALPSDEWKLALIPSNIAADSLAVQEMPFGAALAFACNSGELCVVNADDGTEQEGFWLPCSDRSTCKRLEARFTAYLQLFQKQ